VQLDIVKRGRQSALKDPKFKEGFGSDLVSMKGRNIQAIFKNKSAPNSAPHPYLDELKSLAKKSSDELMKGQKDINTVLRELEASANKAIEEQQK
jgi:hypothetical protein